MKGEQPARLVVAAGNGDEAHALAWWPWYGRAPRSELEGLIREACSVEATEIPTD